MERITINFIDLSQSLPTIKAFIYDCISYAISHLTILALFTFVVDVIVTTLVYLAISQ